MTAPWTTGKVGMMGTSYNGTIPIGAATTAGVEGLEAIMPISAISNWYDYYRANGAGPRAVHVPGRGPGRARGRGLLARRSEPAPQRLICQNYIRNTTQNNIDRATGNSNPFSEGRQLHEGRHQA